MRAWPIVLLLVAGLSSPWAWAPAVRDGMATVRALLAGAPQ